MITFYGMSLPPTEVGSIRRMLEGLASSIDADFFFYGAGTTPILVYTPNLNYNGQDSFTFKVNDGKADSNVATVSISISPLN